ncbi:hypothetical protein BASA62_007325 [Batrachochytrium salamandrivorans]|nr:hypothetical protein BASA62_007325 [Batrachochytrium salamandrivorans]
MNPYEEQKSTKGHLGKENDESSSMISTDRSSTELDATPVDSSINSAGVSFATRFTIIDNWVTKTDGTKIYSRTWAPLPLGPNSVLAVVVFIHGVGEHIQRYNYVFPFFAEAGIKVVGFDQRGFGRTAHHYGQLGDSQGLPVVFQDITDFIESARIPGVPVFLMGHSMGGGIALSYSAQHPEGLRGVISSAPLIAPGKETAPTTIESYLLAVVPSIFSSISIKSAVNPDSLSRDPVANQAYRTDQYVHPWTSIGTAISILKMGEDLANIYSKSYSLPVYITHGTDDVLTSPIASKKFFDDIPSKDKTYNSLEGYYHEAHQEPGDLKQVVIWSYIDWILARL